MIVAPPSAEVWQGDIFADVPWAVARNPQWVAEAAGGGYVKSDPPPAGKRGHLVLSAGRSRGMLLTHECAFDKARGDLLTFARVVPFTTLGERMHEHIRSNRQYAAFHLPAVEGLIEESYVDFRILVSAHPQILEGLQK